VRRSNVHFIGLRAISNFTFFGTLLPRSTGLVALFASELIVFVS
jgi:hypothetical protein